MAEPSVLAALGLLATDTSAGESRDRARRTARWLADLQQRSGGVGPVAGLDRPAWPTALAMLLWRNVGGFEQARERGARFLLRRGGEALENTPRNVVGHDQSLVGWPWVEGTHSWLEPTVMAVLALGPAHREHARVREGLRVIRDRAVPGGGWNWGNSTVLGRPQRPQPDTTGLALLALASTTRDRIVDSALGYLKKRLPGIHATRSLCWGTLALRTWRETTSTSWLELACRALARPGPPRLAELLLAAGAERTLGLLGVGRAS
jgi:hypothetical protein